MLQSEKYLSLVRCLSDQNRILLEGYLAHKWGLAGDLVIGHEYRKTDGTFVGNAAWAGTSNAKYGNAVYFDGTDDGLSFEDLDELDAPRQFGISIWFKREVDKSGTAIDTNHQINNVLLSQSSDGSNDNLEIGTEGNQVEIYMDSGGGAEDTRVAIAAGIQNNVWHHLVLTYNGSDNKLDLYVDGTKIKTWNQFGVRLIVQILHHLLSVLHDQQTINGESFRDGSMIFAFMILTSMHQRWQAFINWVVNAQPLISSPLQYPVNTRRRLIFSSARVQQLLRVQSPDLLSLILR